MGWMSSKNTTTTSISPEQRAAQATALSYAQNAASQPFQQYQGPWTAAYRPELLKAGNMLYASEGVGRGELQGAASGARSAMGFQPMMVGSGNTTAGMTQSQNTTARNSGAFSGDQFMGRYFNPFLQQVAGGMTSEMGRARTMQINADEDKALAAGAYGGSRHGVMDAETTRGFFDTLGRNVGELYARGFDTAAGLGMQDAQRFTDVDRANADRTLTSDVGNADRRLRSDVGNMDRRLTSDQGNMDRRLRADQGNQQAHLGAGQLRLDGSRVLASVGDTMHDNYLDSARGIMSHGALVQDYDQRAIDRDRERFNEWRDYPLRQSQIINGAAGLVQGGQTQTQTRSPGLGEIAMNLLPFAIMKSDKNVKSAKRPVSDDAVLQGFKKMPGTQSWKYDAKKGGPRDPRRHVGPMAQDVKRNLGFGTGTDIPIIDMLGAQSAAISALARKVDDVTDVKIKRTTKRKGK